MKPRIFVDFSQTVPGDINRIYIRPLLDYPERIASLLRTQQYVILYDHSVEVEAILEIVEDPSKTEIVTAILH